MMYLGDPHNFGRRVCLASPHEISKPRNMVWEWLFLSEKSPLNQLLSKKAEEQKTVSPASIFPKLTFSSDTPEKLIQEGRVERLEWFPATKATFGLEEFEKVGRAIGLLVWAGITDLMRQNIVFGVTLDGTPVFGPLDIECAWGDLILPLQTHLLPTSEIQRNECGLAELFYFFSEYPDPKIPAAIVLGYLESFSFLDSIRKEFCQHLLDHLGILEVPIRVIPRNTRVYYSLLNGTRTVEPPLSECERLQLDRRDIPYYFHFLGKSDIYFYGKPGIQQSSELSPELARVALRNRKNIFNGEFAKSDVTQKGGALELLRSLLSEVEEQEISYKELEVAVKDESFELRWGNRMRIACQKRSQ